MKIKTLLNVSSYISIGVTLIMISFFFWVSYQTKRLDEDRALAGAIRNNIYERIIIRDEYFINRENRPRRQWRDKSTKIKKLLETASKRLNFKEDRAILEDMIKDYDDTVDIFNTIIENEKKMRTGGIEGARYMEYDKRLFSQLIVKSYELSDSAARLRASLNEASDTAHHRITLFLVLFVFLVVATVLVNGTLIGRILKNRIEQLRRGAGIIGGGNLDYRIDVRADDELSSLARLMNDMAGNLSRSYTSVENLRAEMENRRRAEEELCASEERFRHTLDNMMEGCQLIGFDYRYLYVNDSVARHGRKPRRELVGRTMQESYPGIEDTQLFKVINSCMNDRIERRMENKFVYPDGSSGWFELSIQPAPEGVFILSMDIDARKRAEEEIAWLAKLPSENPNPVLRVSSDGMLLYANEGSGALLELWGCAIGGLLPSDWLDTVQESLTTNKSKIIDVCCRTRIISVFVAPVTGSGYVNLYGSDVTEHRQAEASIKILNEELEQRVVERTAQLEVANKELEAFSYSVSHDLRTPLRAIDGFSKVLLDKYSRGLEDEAQRYLDIIRKNTQQMGKLIDDLLSFSWIGRKEMRVSRIDMERLAREAFEQVRSQYPDRTIGFTIESPPVASGDVDMITIALMNLLSNAAKFTGSRPETVIEFGGSEENNENTYYVRDNGVGFDMKYADKLFGVFQRLHTMEEFEGTGVGLALVQRIILRHGGRVWAEGAVDQGAVFHFTLPVQGGSA